MPQQINLCTPILLTQKRYFSAQTMAVALSVFFVLGLLLCGYWVWSLGRAAATFERSIATRAPEAEGLKAAIAQSRANAAPVDPSLLALIQARRNQVAQREALKEALNEGMFRPGWGHSDRLSWVARSIPGPVWISALKMDGTRFEVSGYTLEPSALNEWVDKLATSPLMRGMKLATVKVENTNVLSRAAAGDPVPIAGATAQGNARAVWSFQLVSVEPPPVAASTTTRAAGPKP